VCVCASSAQISADCPCSRPVVNRYCISRKPRLRLLLSLVPPLWQGFSLPKTVTCMCLLERITPPQSSHATLHAVDRTIRLCLSANLYACSIERKFSCIFAQLLTIGWMCRGLYGPRWPLALLPFTNRCSLRRKRWLRMSFRIFVLAWIHCNTLRKLPSLPRLLLHC
jgi:hypothetical protein